MKTFKQYVRIREDHTPFSVQDGNDNNSMFGMPDKPENPLAKMMSILWTKHRHAIEPLIEKLAEEDHDLLAAYEKAKEEFAGLDKSKKSDKDGFSGDDNEVRIPKADTFSGEQE